MRPHSEALNASLCDNLERYKLNIFEAFLQALILATPSERAVALLYVLGNLALIGLFELINKRSHK